jgi:hypothetical protein
MGVLHSAEAEAKYLKNNREYQDSEQMLWLEEVSAIIIKVTSGARWLRHSACEGLN